MIVHKKVIFNGEMYWLRSSPVTGIDYGLCPLDHFNEAGEMTPEARGSSSYAVVRDGEIVRLGDVIGTLSDLKEIH